MKPSPPSSRRRFVRSSASGLACLNLLAGSTPASPPRQFRLWAIGDAHVGTDLRRRRESLADAIRQSEQGGPTGGPAFDWDIAINVGDFAGNQSAPDDEEGREVVRQYAAATKHRREDFYDIAGNHDASGPGQTTQWWFRKWVDPLGENPEFSGVNAARRRYPVTGSWERYHFQVGNLVFLMMSDRNDLAPPIGRGERGGYPAGAVTGQTVAWWKEQVEQHQDAIIISAHHHMLRETTVGSGDFEGGTLHPDGTYTSRYHGYQKEMGTHEGSSYLYYVDQQPKAMAFEHYLASHPGAIDFWLGGHTHTNPDDRFHGRSHIERKWDVNFINCCALTRYHVAERARPMSRLLTFTEGQDKVLVQCYLHSNAHAPQGWYPKAERILPLSKPFQPS
jgi:hypothetical protein